MSWFVISGKSCIEVLQSIRFKSSLPLGAFVTESRSSVFLSSFHHLCHGLSPSS